MILNPRFRVASMDPNALSINKDATSSMLNKYGLQLVSQNRDQDSDIGASDDAESSQSVLLANLTKKGHQKKKCGN